MESRANGANMHLVLAYVADLELEVDRLREHRQFLHYEVRKLLRRVQLLCTNARQAGNELPPLPEIEQAGQQLDAVMRDLQEPLGYHPAHDQVIAIAVRPLVEQVFRWQQRLIGAPEFDLRMDLESEHVEWFPVRLRHILENLLSNGMRSHDPDKDQAWVHLQLRVSPDGYEFQVSDNGTGLPAGKGDQMFELFYRAAPTRSADLGVGLPVAKMLAEQSGGTLKVESVEGQGTAFTLVLPRYDVDDYLT
jgi:signal transduction histidine kinase